MSYNELDAAEARGMDREARRICPECGARGGSHIPGCEKAPEKPEVTDDETDETEEDA